MAVSMSAGGSGFMRSDYMISDAAIPLRVEESMEQADNSGRFSKVLSGIGEAKKAAAAEVSGDKAGGVQEVPKEFHELAEAVANGELKLEDIPEDMLSQGMLEELTKLVKLVVEKSPDAEEDIQDTSKDPAAQELLAELAAMLSAQQPAVTPDDKTSELSELSALTAQPEVEAVQTMDIQRAEPVVQQENVQQAQEVTAEVQTPTAFEQKAEPEKPESMVKPVQAEPEQSTVNTGEIAAVKQTADESQNAGQQSSTADSGQQNDSLAGRAEAPQEQTEAQLIVSGRVREDISRAEVSVSRKAPETEQTEQASQQEQPVFSQHAAQRSRVVSKSDELQMIRDSAKPVDENAAQTLVQPQTAAPEKPVIFTRPDGGEVQVKPSEVAQQVADKLTERADSLKDGEVEYSVTLNPEDLGRITVRMTKTADGAVSVSIAAENSRTLKIIEDNGSAIQDTLKQNGVQLESWQTVSESKQETHAEDYQGSSKNPYRESENDHEEQDSDGESFAEIIASM